MTNRERSIQAAYLKGEPVATIAKRLRIDEGVVVQAVWHLQELKGKIREAEEAIGVHSLLVNANAELGREVQQLRREAAGAKREWAEDFAALAKACGEAGHPDRMTPEQRARYEEEMAVYTAWKEGWKEGLLAEGGRGDVVGKRG